MSETVIILCAGVFAAVLAVVVAVVYNKSTKEKNNGKK